VTDSYNQPSINIAENPELLESQSFDQRQVQSFVPAGTTATYQKAKISAVSRLIQLSWSGVLAPAGGESVVLRLYRVRPSSNPSGFGYVLLNNAFTINPASFTDAGGNMDISSTIRPNLCVFPGEYLACSWVHAGPIVMQPLNMNWNFRPVSANEPEPVADIPAIQWPVP
jgi:hypothetical protein